MIKKFKEFLEESIKEIKEKEENNIAINENKEKENEEDLLAMYCCGVFDDLFK